MDVSRHWPVCNCLDLGRIRGDTSFTYNVAQIRNGSLSEGALGQVDLPLVRLQPRENHGQMFQMILECATIYEDVVKKDDHEAA
jgi:hypothetical protein